MRRLTSGILALLLARPSAALVASAVGGRPRAALARVTLPTMAGRDGSADESTYWTTLDGRGGLSAEQQASAVEDIAIGPYVGGPAAQQPEEQRLRLRLHLRAKAEALVALHQHDWWQRALVAEGRCEQLDENQMLCHIPGRGCVCFFVSFLDGTPRSRHASKVSKGMKGL